MALWFEERGGKTQTVGQTEPGNSALTLSCLFQVVASVVHQDNFSGFAPLQPQVRLALSGK